MNCPLIMSTWHSNYSVSMQCVVIMHGLHACSTLVWYKGVCRNDNGLIRVLILEVEEVLVRLRLV